MVQTLRGLDGILYSCSATIILFLHPSIGRNELGNFDIFCAVPVFVLGWFSHRLPKEFSDIINWNKTVIRLRFFSLFFVFLSPFLIWWYSIPGNIYFMITSQLAMLSGIGLFFQLSLLMLGLARYAGNKLMEWEARFVKFLIFYLLLVPFLAFLITYFLDSYIYSVTNFEDLFILFRYVSPWLLFFLVLPIMFSISLLFQLRYTLVKYFEFGVSE